MAQAIFNDLWQSFNRFSRTPLSVGSELHTFTFQDFVINPRIGRGAREASLIYVVGGNDRSRESKRMRRSAVLGVFLLAATLAALPTRGTAMVRGGGRGASGAARSLLAMPNTRVCQ